MIAVSTCKVCLQEDLLREGIEQKVLRPEPMGLGIERPQKQNRVLQPSV